MLLGNGAFHQKRDAATLSCAAICGYAACLDLLLQHVPSPDTVDEANGTPLMCAARGGHVELARHLLDVGATIDFVVLPAGTALHIAVALRQETMVARLLDWGANVAARDAQNRTALDLARESSHLQPTMPVRHRICRILEEHCTPRIQRRRGKSEIKAFRHYSQNQWTRPWGLLKTVYPITP